MSIEIEHPIAHVHTQNGLAESLIKRLKLAHVFTYKKTLE